MKIAIASDLHDHQEHLTWFLEECKKRNITQCYFLGDMIRPTLAKVLFQSLKTHFIFGNNDGDHVRTMRFATPETKIADYCFDELTVNEKQVFLTHYPLLAENAARSGKYDAVFYGHDHTKHEERLDKTLLVNPGELAGFVTGIISFYVWDTHNNVGEFIVKKQ